MKKKFVEHALEQYVAAKFPWLEVCGDLLVERRGPVLSGLAFDRSQMDQEAFTLLAFGQLLTIPTDIIDFGLSRQVGTFRVTDGEQEAFIAAAAAAEAEGMPFLARAREPQGLLAHADALLSPLSDHRLAYEVRAHLLVLEGAHDAARAELAALISELDPPEVPHEEGWLERARNLRAMLERSPAGAVELLGQWIDQTLAGLPRELARVGASAR